MKWKSKLVILLALVVVAVVAVVASVGSDLEERSHGQHKKSHKKKSHKKSNTTAAATKIRVVNALENSHTFTIDHTPGNNCFRKDGQFYRFIAGNMQYYHVPYGYWQDRMLKMRAAGLNALQMYLAWNKHEPFKGVYDFDEQNNIFEYFQMAKSNSLDVILRMGPYINGEQDYGGLPFWLLNVNPRMKIRTSDPTFLAQVKSFWDVLLPKIKPHLFINGGNIITVQIENEYGFHSTCDKAYLKFLYELALSHLGPNVVYVTTDNGGSGLDFLHCGEVGNGTTHTTTDFDIAIPPSIVLNTLRQAQPTGPLVNSEFYPGWFHPWNTDYHVVADDFFIQRLTEQLSFDKATSVAIYPIHGGTNFGFSAGGMAYDSDPEYYISYQPTYDFNAPITENGDTTTKYDRIRAITPQFLPQTLPPVPKNIPRKNYGMVTLTKSGDIFSNIERFTTFRKIVVNGEPPTYEAMLLNYGFALYEHTLVASDLLGARKLSTTTDDDDEFKHRSAPPLAQDAILHGQGVHDRAIVFIDKKRMGVLCRICRQYEVNLGKNIAAGQKLSLFVENTGRSGFGDDYDPKGLNVNHRLYITVGLGSTPTTDSNTLLKWTITPIPVNESSTLWGKPTSTVNIDNSRTLDNFVPSRYQGSFLSENDPTLGHPADTFLRLNADDNYGYVDEPRFWQKGVALVNGRNLGRYWLPHSSAQTLFVPGVWLRSAPQLNYLTILETDYSPCECVNAPPPPPPPPQTTNIFLLFWQQQLQQQQQQQPCKCQAQMSDTPMLNKSVYLLRFASVFDGGSAAGQFFTKYHKPGWWQGGDKVTTTKKLSKKKLEKAAKRRKLLEFLH